MTVKSFVDTNVLACVYDRTDTLKRERAKWLVAQQLADQTMTISTQVINELAATLLKPAFGMTLDEVRRALGSLDGSTLVLSDLSTVQRALDARSRYQVSLWDGLIIAAAERARCREILTEDLSHGQEYFGVIARNPFITSVSEV